DEVSALIAERGKPARETEPVYVVGAGPAGLAAALALVDAKLDVEVLEQDTVVGGKAWTRRDRAEDRARDHGIHGWWGSYVNFDSLLRRAGEEPARIFRNAQGGAVLGPDDKLAVFGKARIPLPSPFHLFYYFLQLGFVGLFDFLSAIRLVLEVIAFNHR